MEPVIFTCDHRSFTACLTLARKHAAGLEMQAFAQPQVLDGDWREILDDYRRQLAGFTGPFSCHGAFYDLASGSPDAQVQAVARRRYEQNLDIAAELGAQIVVFHANYLPQVDGRHYRLTWTSRQVDFWGNLSRRAAAQGITVALENMWEPDPDVLGDVIDPIGSSYVRACVDVGHVHLYSQVPFERWLARLGRQIVYVHMNNNPGMADEHRALDDGVIDYETILPALRLLEPAPILALELENAAAIERSLRYMDLVLA